MMPYIDAFFMPRAYGDRPKVVPDGAVNFAFLGQFAETPRDTIFTTEYSMRTGMEAVYTLLNVDRGVPEVWGSVYDVRDSAGRHREAPGRQEGHGHGRWASWKSWPSRTSYEARSPAPTSKSCSRSTTSSKQGRGSAPAPRTARQRRAGA